MPSCNILFIGAEYRGIAKRGGLADVIADMPTELRNNNIEVAVIIPYYEIVKNKTTFIKEFTVKFGKNERLVQLYTTEVDGFDVHLLKCDEFFGGIYGEVYINSDKYKHGPFEDDAKRFSFFCEAVLQILTSYDKFANINILHCHDWHTTTLMTLLKYKERFKDINGRVKTLFTIHNLDYQGVRPFSTKDNKDRLISFESWFPDTYKVIKNSNEIMGKIRDVKDTKCFSSMRAGINLADFVNTVSPTYAKEITQKDDIERNFFGGRGLEEDLKKRESNGSLVGVLNGIDYSKFEIEEMKNSIKNGAEEELNEIKKRTKRELLLNFVEDIKEFIDGSLLENGASLKKHLKDFDFEKVIEKPMVVSVGRAATQKLSIILESYKNDILINEVLKRDIFFVCIANGQLSKKLEIINDHKNGFYLAGFMPEDFTNKIYVSADFLFMPSDFEPCGISQIIALKSGTLPIVNKVGGLNDTVINEKTGLLFSGESREESKENLIKTVDRAVSIFYNEREHFLEMRETASKQDFSWNQSIKKYIEIYSKLLDR